jgi:hypothetical protein
LAAKARRSPRITVSSRARRGRSGAGRCRRRSAVLTFSATLGLEVAAALAQQQEEAVDAVGVGPHPATLDATASHAVRGCSATSARVPSASVCRRRLTLPNRARSPLRSGPGGSGAELAQSGRSRPGTSPRASRRPRLRDQFEPRPEIGTSRARESCAASTTARRRRSPGTRTWPAPDAARRRTGAHRPPPIDEPVTADLVERIDHLLGDHASSRRGARVRRALCASTGQPRHRRGRSRRACPSRGRRCPAIGCGRCRVRCQVR